MTDPQDVILPLLREMRAEMKGGFDRMDRKFAEHDARFDKLERRFDNIRQAVNGGSVRGRYAAAEVEGRLQAIEKQLEQILSFEQRLTALETHPDRIVPVDPLPLAIARRRVLQRRAASTLARP